MTVYPIERGSVNTEGALAPSGTDPTAALTSLLADREPCVVAYHPGLARALGSVTAALLLSQFLHWSRCPTVVARQGWFYKKRDEIEQETGLSRYEQETARRKLVESGVLKEERRGLARLLWFRVDLARLAVLVGGISPNREKPAASHSAPKRSAGFAPPTESTETILFQQRQQQKSRDPAAGTKRPAAAVLSSVFKEGEEEGKAAVNRLYEAGLRPLRECVRLVQEAGVAEVLRQIANLFREKLRRVVPNPGGWLRRAIERRYRVGREVSERPVEVCPDTSKPYSAPNDAASLRKEFESSAELPNLSGRIDKTAAAAAERDDDPLAALWSAALGILSGLVPLPTLKTHLMPLRITAIEGDMVTLAGASPFTREWLEKRHGDALRQALAQAMGRPTLTVQMGKG